MQRPKKILSKHNLRSTWNSSRDSKKKAGARGTDNVTAEAFSANLSTNIDRIHHDIMSCQFGFSSLRGVKIPKRNGDYRLICIPCLKDRLVQRTILTHVSNGNLLPNYPSSAFGFIPERGVIEATDAVIRLRQQYGWTFETDIRSFFDSIERNRLKAEVEIIFKRSSLRYLMKKVIDCEVKETPEIRLRDFGVKRYKGIRQGMPLSPLLSNIALRKFDGALTRKGIPAVRYVDDLVAFASSKEAAIEIGTTIKKLLLIEGLNIPDVSESGKTKISSKGDPVEFLGWSIRHHQQSDTYRRFVSDEKIDAIKQKISDVGNVSMQMANGKDLTQTLRQLSQTTNAYRSTYSSAENITRVVQEINRSSNEARTEILLQIFGEDAVRGLTLEQRTFIGLDAEHGELEFESLV